MAALLALDEALLLLGLPSAATADDVRSAHRAALGALQAQLQAGTLDRPTFRAFADRLDVAVRSALVAARASALATAGPDQPLAPVGQPPSGSPSAAGSGTTLSAPVTAQAPPQTPASVTGQPPGVTGATGAPVVEPVETPPPPGATGAPVVEPVETLQPTNPASAAAPAPSSPDAPAKPVDGSRPGTPGAVTGPNGGPEVSDSQQRTPRSDPAATLAALRSMPLMNQTPPTQAQHELWTAVLVPAARHHVEAAAAMAATTMARTDPQVAASTMHVALTLALPDLTPDERRALLPLAAGVYEQLESVLPRVVVSGLPPRDLLGGLPLQLWAPGPEVRVTALVIAFALVAFAIWVGLR